jgi:hypothetical protein
VLAVWKGVREVSRDLWERPIKAYQALKLKEAVFL